MSVKKFLLTLTVFFTTTLSATQLFALKHATIGEVVSIREGILIVREEGTGTEYIVTASPEQLPRIQQGYRVEVEISDGAAKLLDILGMEMQAEPFPYQDILVPPDKVEEITRPKEMPEKRVFKSSEHLVPALASPPKSYINGIVDSIESGILEIRMPNGEILTVVAPEGEEIPEWVKAGDKVLAVVELGRLSSIKKL